MGTGEEAIGPPLAVPILAFCSEPRTRAEVVDAFGGWAGGAWDAMEQGGLLVPPDQADDTPTFFQTFASLDVHRRMLSDRIRVDGFARAIEALVEPGMVVLDAGTGTGILACIAARAGARRVFAVDRSEVIESARAVVAASGCQDVVELIQADLRQVQLPEKVDLVISETFGAMALAENGIADVAACVERNLAPGGLVIPSGVQLSLAPVGQLSEVAETLGCFDTLHGVDLSPLRPAALGRAIVQSIPPSALSHPGQRFATLPFPGPDHARGSITFEAPAADHLHGWAGWFDLRMTPDQVLPTGPHAPGTHWRQVFFPIEPWALTGEPLEVDVSVAPAPGDRRGLEVVTRWRQSGRTGSARHRVV